MCGRRRGVNVKTDAENSQSESKIADLVRPACQGLECDLPFLFEGLKGLKGDVVAIVKHLIGARGRRRAREERGRGGRSSEQRARGGGQGRKGVKVEVGARAGGVEG
eukprot:1952535-Rhodomonas_salina.2